MNKPQPEGSVMPIQ